MNVIANESKAVADLAPLVGKDSLIVFRVKTGGRAEPDPSDPAAAWTGREWVERWRPALQPGKRSDGGLYALQDHNEVFSTHNLAWWVQFEIERMRAWTEHGEITTYGNFGVDSFKPEHVAAMAPMMRYGIEHGHILRFNTYWYDDIPEVQALDRLFYFLPLVNAWPAARWFIGELGWAANDAAYQPGQLVWLTNWIRLIRHPGFLGAALWALIGSGAWEDWKQSNIGTDWRIVAAANG